MIPATVRRDVTTIAVRLATALSIVWIVAYASGYRPLSFDEIEFTKSTRWVGSGAVPYRDFWEHHTPLQWYLFAPVERLFDGPGASTVVALRFSQLFLWLATFLILWRIVERITTSPAARFGSVALLLASAAFAMTALEYRVDALSTFLVVAALNLSPKARTPRTFAAIGALSALAILANMRSVAVAAVVAVLPVIIDVPARRWRFRLREAATVFGGGIAVAAVYAVYLWATGSLGAFRAHVLGDNAVMGTMAERFAQRLFWTSIAVAFRNVDIAGIVFAVMAIAGFAMALRELRRPGEAQALVLVNAVSIAAVYEMPVHYPYHFISVFLLAAPLVAFAADRAVRTSPRAENAITVVIVAAVVVNLVFLGRASRLRFRYQDEIMRTADALTRPDEVVWDGVGFALRRRPAYEYWFLPLGVRHLVFAHRIQPFTAASIDGVKPAAIVLDRRDAIWMRTTPGMLEDVSHEYVPLLRNLWIPAMSARVRPGHAVSWTVFRDGEYRVVAAPSLAAHPWFDQPLECGLIEGAGAAALRIDTERYGPPPAGALTLNAGGTTLAPDQPMHLSKGMRLTLASRAAVPVGVFVVPAAAKALFVPPQGGVTFEEPLFELR